MTDYTKALEAGATAIEAHKIPKGEYVSRKAGAKKVYMTSGYDRAERKFTLIDADDISRVIYVDRSTLLAIGFTY